MKKIVERAPTRGAPTANILMNYRGRTSIILEIYSITDLLNKHRLFNLPGLFFSRELFNNGQRKA